MKKLNKGKFVGVIAAALSTVSLMGVGFASWIITGTSPLTDAGNINVTVGEIKDSGVVFDGTPTMTDNTLVFDADGSQTSGGLIDAGEKTNKEDMKFIVKYKVKVYTDVAFTWKVNAKLVDNTDGALIKAVKAKYIAYPTTSKALDLTEKEIFNKDMTSASTTDIQVTTTSGEGFSTYEVTQTFTFTWGEAFNNVNPVKVTGNDSIYTDKQGVADSKETATTALLVKNLQGLHDLSFTGLKLQLSTSLK